MLWERPAAIVCVGGAAPLATPSGGDGEQLLGRREGAQSPARAARGVRSAMGWGSGGTSARRGASQVRVCVSRSMPLASGRPPASLAWPPPPPPPSPPSPSPTRATCAVHLGPRLVEVPRRVRSQHVHVCACHVVYARRPPAGQGCQGDGRGCRRSAGAACRAHVLVHGHGVTSRHVSAYFEPKRVTIYGNRLDRWSPRVEPRSIDMYTMSNTKKRACKRVSPNQRIV